MGIKTVRKGEDKLSRNGDGGNLIGEQIFHAYLRIVRGDCKFSAGHIFCTDLAGFHFPTAQIGLYAGNRRFGRRAGDKERREGRILDSQTSRIGGDGERAVKRDLVEHRGCSGEIQGNVGGQRHGRDNGFARFRGDGDCRDLRTLREIDNDAPVFIFIRIETENVSHPLEGEAALPEFEHGGNVADLCEGYEIVFGGQLVVICVEIVDFRYMSFHRRA